MNYKERYNRKLIEAEGWLLQRNEAIAQRDELLAALKACFDVMERTHGSTIPIHLGGYCEEQDWSTSYRLASAAIKHAEEGK